MDKVPKVRSDMQFTRLEQAVLDWLASHAGIANLAEQLAACRPMKRDLTGVGSFTKLAVPVGIARIDLESTRRQIDGPWIDGTEGIQFGGGSLLFLDESGYVETLELFANGHHFEESVTEFTLSESAKHGVSSNGGPLTSDRISRDTELPPLIN